MKYIDLFAGIGGFHQALNRFNATCVFASEWNKPAAEVYFTNHGIKPDGDITQIHESKIPPHDMLCGGFPCQPFSLSGKQMGFEDTRGTLFFEISRIVSFHKPKVILLENVKNLEGHDNGKTLDIVIETLRNLNYKVYYEVLNASDYGLPQNRERIFIVCFRQDLGVTAFNFPRKTHQPICLLDILEDPPSHVKYINKHNIVFTRTFVSEIDLFGEVFSPNRPIQIGYINKGGQGERIYSPHGHAVTLSAHGGGIGARTGLYYIDNKVRKLSPRECARVQGFPDTFVIDPSPYQSYKQFGNSVAVSVLIPIISEIYLLGVFGEQTDVNS